MVLEGRAKVHSQNRPAALNISNIKTAKIRIATATTSLSDRLNTGLDTIHGPSRFIRHQPKVGWQIASSIYSRKRQRADAIMSRQPGAHRRLVPHYASCSTRGKCKRPTQKSGPAFLGGECASLCADQFWGRRNQSTFGTDKSSVSKRREKVYQDHSVSKLSTSSIVRRMLLLASLPIEVKDAALALRRRPV